MIRFVGSNPTVGSMLRSPKQERSMPAVAPEPVEGRRRAGLGGTNHEPQFSVRISGLKSKNIASRKWHYST